MFTQGTFVDFWHRSNHLSVRKIISLETWWTRLEMASGVVDSACGSVEFDRIFRPPFLREVRKVSYRDATRDDPRLGAAQTPWKWARQGPKRPPSKIFQRHALNRTSDLCEIAAEKRKMVGQLEGKTSRQGYSRRGLTESQSFFVQKNRITLLPPHGFCFIPKHT